MTGLLIVTVSIYCLCMLRYFFGWKKLKEPEITPSKQVIVSVIVPYRNEEQNIGACLRHLCAQHYPSHLYEVIAVNDHSTDQSLSIVNEVSGEFTVLKKLDVIHAEGKKSAITAGVNASRGTLIVTVDADMQMGNNWLETIASFYAAHQFEMIILPVVIRNGENWFDKWQSLELMSLTGTSAGAVELNDPVMCNGANLAFTKNAFLRVKGYSGNNEVLSGDDMFLMLKLKKENPRSIGYLHSQEVISATSPVRSPGAFIDQRTRWASKTGHYRDPSLLFLSAVVWIANLSVLVIVILSIAGLLQKWLLIFVLIKFSIDFMFLFEVSKFYDKKNLLWHYPVMMLIYPLYATTIPVLSLFYKPSWKIKKYKNQTG